MTSRKKQASGSHRQHRWGRDEVADLPTAAILDQLGWFGIFVTEEDFLRDVAESMGADDICRQWEERSSVTAKGWDVDFPWLAADVLWRRLAPDRLSNEQLDDLMQEGYARIASRDAVGGCALWLKVWEGLKPRFSPDMRKIEDAESVFSGGQLLFNWCQDFVNELGNAARADKAFHEHRLRYSREFCRQFPESHNLANNMMRAMAESLFKLGRVEETEGEFCALVDAYPGNPWSYIAWGDLHAGFFGGAANPLKAEELYRKGLGIDKKMDGMILERIRDLKKG